jgi:hypothetical protein
MWRSPLVDGRDYLTTMASSMPELLERVWTDAMPGREGACMNEMLRELQRLLTPRPPPPVFKSACANLMVGRRLPATLVASQLTSLRDQISSACWRLRQANSNRISNGTQI